MSKLRYTVPICEREWESRSLAELVELLTHRYRKPTRQRIEAIATVLPRILSSTRERRDAYGRLATAFTSLSELIDAHERLKHRILWPAIVRVERDPTSMNQSVCEALLQQIAGLEPEHNRLRRVSVDLRHAVIEIKGSPASMDEAVLALNLEMLVLLLNERLDLEDRYLWPRVLVLLGREL
jgi:iron-sulfur cluster repair protein YtfE (RIC family)